MNIKSLFKKKQSVATITATIEKIHNEFDSASERLLKEAKDIIARNKDADKGNRLLALGFQSAAPVAQSRENCEKETLSLKIEYYQMWYPNNKFITEDAVKSICEKYGLMFGDAHYYKGDVPEKNLAEMESFKLRDEDKERRTNIGDYYQRSLMLSQMNAQRGLLERAPLSTPSYREQPKELREYVVQRPFKICAPEKDFDTKYTTVKDGYKLEYDPIVLQPVDMGYLIVTKWGLEANDPIVINEKKN